MELRPEQESKMMMRDVGMVVLTQEGGQFHRRESLREYGAHYCEPGGSRAVCAEQNGASGIHHGGGARRHTGPRDEDLHHDLSLAHGMRLEIHALVVDTLERAACGSGRCSWA